MEREASMIVEQLSQLLGGGEMLGFEGSRESGFATIEDNRATVDRRAVVPTAGGRGDAWI